MLSSHSRRFDDQYMESIMQKRYYIVICFMNRFWNSAETETRWHALFRFLIVDPHVAYSHPLRDNLIEQNTTLLHDLLDQAESSFSSQHSDNFWSICKMYVVFWYQSVIVFWNIFPLLCSIKEYKWRYLFYIRTLYEQERTAESKEMCFLNK